MDKLLLGLVLICSLHSFGQEYEFGKISKEELLEQSYPLDSAANAAVLYKSKKIRYKYDKEQGFVLITEVHKRIKLYNKNGFDYATEEMFLFDSNGVKEKMLGLTGKTYSISGDDIVETKLKKEGVFKVADSDYINKVSFTMPAIKEGSIIEFKYKILSPFSRSIDRLLLQYDIPIKKIKISLAIPEYYNFRKRTSGFLPINIKESSDRQSDLFLGNSIDYNVTKYQIDSENVPAFKKEPYSGNYKNYISTLSFELQSTQFPYSSITNYGTTWGAIARGAFKDSRFGGAMKNNKYFKDDIDQLVSEISNPLEKTKLIYEYVKDKITWNNRNALIPRKSMKKVYQEGIGNAAEINLMLIAMLKYAKINVKPILVTTNDKPLSMFPTIQGLDYVLARVRINDDILFLDATDKYGEPNVLPNRVVHGLGRLIAESGNSEMIFFRPSKISKKQNILMCEMGSDGNVRGRQRIKHTFYEAHDFRIKNTLKKEEEQRKRIGDLYSLQNISEYKISNLKDIGKPVVESFAFETSDEVEVIDDELFFSPLLFLRNRENIFKSNERLYPVDLGYGVSKSYSVNIKIPEGYEIIEKPDDMGLKLSDDIGSFMFRMKVVGNTIQISVKETLNVPLVMEQYYTELKTFYDLLIQKESDQIVLKKI
ncbi:transglutaminase domain-containing protein [Aquimarina sp. AU474]|uniref:transglutaminase domain-containing protein n=1 Tax=Aquimarina sp. AU474 TaxID=2108529 RepID=UPI00135C8796|nr:transglutaminase domain-containing protein [Aquimarina sp. AU474]